MATTKKARTQPRYPSTSSLVQTGICILVILGLCYFKGIQAEEITPTRKTNNAGRGCQTACDCYKNSGLFDTSDQHLCYECSRRDSTCHIIAACASGYMCSLNPTFNVSLETPLGTPDIECLDMTKQNKELLCSNDDDCTEGLQDDLAILTMSGYCMPTGRCRYLPYGLAKSRTVLERSALSFNHITCRDEQRRCSTNEDCFQLGRQNHVLQDATVVCEAGFCRAKPDLLPKVTPLRNQQTMTTSTTLIASTSTNSNITDVFGQPCRSEQDCVDLAQRVDPNAAHGCYACVRTATATTSSPSTKQEGWHVGNVCVKTASGCDSGICLHGQCLGKACDTHFDCLEVGGSTSSCHRCNPTTKLCTATRICPYGSYCVIDLEKDRQCSPLVKMCQPAPADLLIGDPTNEQFCIPLNSAQSVGYQRLSDMYSAAHKKAPSSPPVPPRRTQQQERQKQTQEQHVTIAQPVQVEEIKLFTKRRTLETASLTLATDAKLEVSALLHLYQTNKQNTKVADTKKDPRIDASTIVTDHLPEREEGVKVVQRTPAQAEWQRQQQQLDQQQQLSTANTVIETNGVTHIGTAHIIPAESTGGENTKSDTAPVTPPQPTSVLQQMANNDALTLALAGVCLVLFVLIVVLYLNMPTTNANGEIVQTVYVKDGKVKSDPNTTTAPLLPTSSRLRRNH